MTPTGHYDGEVTLTQFLVETHTTKLNNKVTYYYPHDVMLNSFEANKKTKPSACGLMDKALDF